jgi:hypothetical protein
MQKSILFSLLVLSVALGGYGFAKSNSQFRNLQTQTRSLTAERDSLFTKVQALETSLAELQASLPARPESVTEPAPASAVEPKTAALPEPQITVDARGRKSYLFPELVSAAGQTIARNAQFRELLGFTKLSFRTDDGVRYFDVDEVHPEVARTLGFDPNIQKRRLIEETRQAQIRGAQAQFQQELRTKAAIELAEREKAAAERLRSEAALRDAQARERLADAAERAASNPPQPQRIIQKVLVAVPYYPDKPEDPRPPESPKPQ